MATLCYSVRLKSLELISPICYKAVGFDGSSDFIPAKFVYGPDMDVQKSDAWWIAAWILERKSLTYSHKKSAKFTDNGMMIPNVVVQEHVPEHVEPVNNDIEDLKR